jgi:hypothetical protein
MNKVKQHIEYLQKNLSVFRTIEKEVDKAIGHVRIQLIQKIHESGIFMPLNYYQYIYNSEAKLNIYPAVSAWTAYTKVRKNYENLISSPYSCPSWGKNIDFEIRVDEYIDTPDNDSYHVGAAFRADFRFTEEDWGFLKDMGKIREDKEEVVTESLTCSI